MNTLTDSPAQSNPELGGVPADFVPMAMAMQKLEIPKIEGYHLHWMRGTPDRIERARRAGYEFVKPEEVQLNNTSISSDASQSANTDMGTRVSVVAGGTDPGNGQALRLYLMKVKEEWWLKSKEVLAGRSEQIAESFRRGFDAHPGNPGDVSNRYVKGTVPAMFRKRK